jgi:Spy/CpxP family protein refolding chaperone
VKIKTTQCVLLLVFLAVSSCAFAQARHMTTGSSSCNAAGVCLNGTPPASGSTTNSNVGASSDPLQQNIWKVAQQLGLTSDQRSELSSELKAQKDERAEIDKALQDARGALANALADGQTFLDTEIENLASADAKMREYEVKLWAKLYAVLTPDQQRRLLSMSTPLSLATAPHGTVQGQ